MPNMKSQRRTKTRELKYTGLPLPIRARLAKLIIRGDGYQTVELLLKHGATVVKSWGCECCDPYATKEWDYKGRRFATDYGSLDRKLSEFVQKRHAESRPAPPIVETSPVHVMRSEQDYLDEKAASKPIEPKVCPAYNPTGICDGEPICAFCGR